MLVEHLALMAFLLAASLVVVTLIVRERDLIKVVIYSAAQSVFYSIVLYILMVPDVALAYIAVTVGLYTALMVFAIMRTERFEKP